jgi:hypothetical protein
MYVTVKDKINKKSGNCHQTFKKKFYAGAKIIVITFWRDTFKGGVLNCVAFLSTNFTL